MLSLVCNYQWKLLAKYILCSPLVVVHLEDGNLAPADYCIGLARGEVCLGLNWRSTRRCWSLHGRSSGFGWFFSSPFFFFNPRKHSKKQYVVMYLRFCHNIKKKRKPKLRLEGFMIVVFLKVICYVTLFFF